MLRFEGYPREKVEVAYSTAAYQLDEVRTGVLMLIEEMYYNDKTAWKLVLHPFTVNSYLGIR